MIRALVYPLLFLGLLCGGLYLLQPQMVFMPHAKLAETPADWGLAYEDVWPRTADGVTLHAWYLPRPDARQVLLFFHGNAGNISHRRASLAIFHQLGLAVLIIDYRGYGRSQGRPSEAGIYRDATAAWDYLVETRGIDPDAILIFGRSLGGAVAARLASTVQAGGLILESTFSSVPDLARTLYPLLWRLTVLRYDFDTVAALATVRCPVLVLHSPEDEIIPYALGQRVYAAARPPKDFQALSGDHNGGFLLSQPGYEQGLARFLARTGPPPSD